MSVNATTVHMLNHDARHESASLIDVLNHQLRTPLSALLGHIELLQESGLDLSEDAERSFTVIVGAASRLAEVADTISRIADRQAGHADVVGLPAAVGQVAG